MLILLPTSALNYCLVIYQLALRSIIVSALQVMRNPVRVLQ